MYREPIDSMAAEIARLRAEVRRLEADAGTARRMTAPRRALMVAAPVIVAASLAASVCALLASRSDSDESRECRLQNRVLSAELMEARTGLLRETGDRGIAEDTLSKERATCEQSITTLRWRLATDVCHPSE